ncbi:hypothetical protein Pla52o_25030 [Novipirellula galeiformis]|uniref:Uncharacterized protein n=2 Tax=Novipirellula galeiformis TaxID=2528004 RepID=A0A5C6CEE5_9BACT|nr:hypothetical protein Pla52o_25030 [Novipirellula galeiformis]
MRIRPQFSLRSVLAATLIIAVLIASWRTYENWGYERHLAVEAVPSPSAIMDSTFQIAIEYRKRFWFLPGAESVLVPVDRDSIQRIRGDALAAYDWSVDDLAGTTYYFSSDHTPPPGWDGSDPFDFHIPEDG